MTRLLSRRKSTSWVAAQQVWQLAAALLLALVGIAIYANSFQAPFVFDSIIYIQENPAVREVWPWVTSLGGPNSMGGADRPVGFITFALNYARDGLNVWGYHAVNLQIHILAAWLLFDLVRRTLSRGSLAAKYSAHAWGLALAVALVWLVHPLQTNCVTYVYQRLESLMALFYLATLWCFVRGLDSRWGVAWLAGSVLCCALGMGTKEVMVTAPLLVLWYDRAFAASSWRELFRERWGYYAALAATWGILAVLMYGNREQYVESGVLVVKNLSPLQYALSQPGVIVHYLRLAFWPDRLCLDYDWPVAKAASQIVPQALAIGALVAISVWCMFRRPALGFLCGAFFLILAPTSSVAPIKDLAFEHRMYLPLAAVVTLVMLAVWHLVQMLAARWLATGESRRLVGRDLALVALVIVLAALGWRTVRRNEDYRSPVAFWQNNVAQTPTNARAHASLSRALVDVEDWDGAMDEVNLAIEYNPEAAIPYTIRGNLHQRRHEYEEALEDYGRAIAIDPRYAMAYYNRGNTLDKMDRWQDAIEDFDRAIALSPNNAAAYLGRGVDYGRLAKHELALRDLTKAIEIEPDLAAAYIDRARVFFNMHRLRGAWMDAVMAQRLGQPPDGAFLAQLQAAVAAEQAQQRNPPKPRP